MKTLLITLTSLFVLMISGFTSASDTNLVFKAGDKSIETKLCISLAEDNLSKSKVLFNRIYNFSFTNTSTAKVKIASREVTCNELDIVTFTAQYHSGDTFDYINKRAVAKYRLTDTEINIIDLAREQSSLDLKEEIIASR